MSFSRSPTAMTDWRSMPPDASQPLRLRRSRHANKGPGSFGLAQFPSQTDWAALNRTGARCSPCRGYPLRDDCDAVAKFAYRCDGSCNLNFPRSLGAEREARVPTHDVVGHAYDLLVRWIKTGTAPPSAPRIQIAAFGAPGTPSVIARDDLGLALGGIRLSELAVPTAQNVGVNTGPGACVRGVIRCLSMSPRWMGSIRAMTATLIKSPTSHAITLGASISTLLMGSAAS